MPPESSDLRASLLINKRWRDDPVLFVLEMFGIVLDAWQVDVINVYHKHNRIALKASKGPGKSFLLACICWHFLVTRDHPNIAAISESRENLRDGLWKEMARLQKMSRKVEGSEKRLLEMMFEVTAQRVALRQDPENWFMSARGWKRDADAQQQSTALAGLHAEYCMFILDEAGGIPDAVAITAEAVLATGTECHVIIAGNPTHLEGPLWRASTKERDLWHVVEINGDPDNPKRAPRVKIEWAREQIKRHGRDNPWVKVNVFGEFPPSSINALLGPDEVQAAMRRKPDHDSVEFAQKRLGVDTARFGDDCTVIFPRQGLMAWPCVEMRNARNPEIAARVAKIKNEWKSECEFIDDTGGFGGGVIDCLLQTGFSPVGVNFGSRGTTDPRYFNRRSEMWFELAEWVKRGGSLPDDPVLAADLVAPTYTFQEGKFRLEEKDQIKSRLGRSPDRGDALALTFAVPEAPAARNAYELAKAAASQPQQFTQHDFDPLE